MIYKIDCSRWGRFFTVPCNVVDDYIKISDGSFIKVLLCILCRNSDTINTSEISNICGINEQTVNDAVIYWKQLNVISAEIDNSNKTVNPVANIQDSSQSTNTQTNEIKTKKSIKYSPKDLSNLINTNSELKYLTEDFERIIGRDIKDFEIIGLLNLLEYYEFSAGSIIMIVEYCHKLGKDSFAYIESIAKDWHKRNIISYSDIENEIISQSKKKSFEFKVAKAFGIENKLAKRHLEYIDSWREMGFDIDMISIAYDKCMESKNQLRFSYIDGILKKWAGNDIKTPEQVVKENKSYNSKVNNKYSKNKNNNASYDLNEWDNYIQNFDPNKG